MNSVLNQFELVGLRHFYVIAYHRGFSKAARATGISQPALSTGLKKLEESLKTSLVVRSAGEFTLTPAGSALFDFCRQLEGGLTTVMKQISGEAIVPLERLRIGTAFSIGYGPLADLFTALTRTSPSVEAEVTSFDSYQLLRDLQDGKIDAAFLPDDVQTGDLRFVNLVKDQVVLVASSKTGIIPIPANWRTALIRIPLITYPSGSPMRALVDRILLREKLAFHSSISVSGVEALKTMVGRGVGIGFVLRSLVQGELSAGHLKEVPVQISLPKRGISLATRHTDESLALRIQLLYNSRKNADKS